MAQPFCVRRGLSIAWPRRAGLLRPSLWIVICDDVSSILPSINVDTNYKIKRYHLYVCSGTIRRSASLCPNASDSFVPRMSLGCLSAQYYKCLEEKTGLGCPIASTRPSLLKHLYIATSRTEFLIRDAVMVLVAAR